MNSKWEKQILQLLSFFQLHFIVEPTTDIVSFTGDLMKEE